MLIGTQVTRIGTITAYFTIFPILSQIYFYAYVSTNIHFFACIVDYRRVTIPFSTREYVNSVRLYVFLLDKCLIYLSILPTQL